MLHIASKVAFKKCVSRDFFRDHDGEAGRQKVRYCLGEHYLVEFDAADCEHIRRHRV